MDMPEVSDRYTGRPNTPELAGKTVAGLSALAAVHGLQCKRKYYTMKKEQAWTPHL